MQSFFFPQELINELVDYFAERYGLTVSNETAIEHLDAMADLYESFIEFAQTK